MRKKQKGKEQQECAEEGSFDTFAIMHNQILSILNLPNDEFLRLCTVSNYQGSGPGGQKRNRTLSGVRLKIDEFNLEIKQCVERSAEANLKLAIQALKIKIALEAHSDEEFEQTNFTFSFPGSKGKVNPANPGYGSFIYKVLQLMQLHSGQIRPAAEAFGLSSSALLRCVAQDKQVLQKIQSIRRSFDLGPLKTR